MQRSLSGVVVLSALLGALLLAVAAPAGAHGRWHHRDVTVVKSGESIQAAVDAAEAGDTIVVKRGVYAENVVITTDGITLKGRGAKIVPPATPGAPNGCSFGGPAGDGICGAGQVDFPPDGPPVVNDALSDVTIKGFKVEGFEGTGIIFVGAEDPDIVRNATKDNHEYGIARFVSSGGKILGNWASGSEEAGIYVGDSPDADVLIAGNQAVDNVLFGFFLRDAANGKLVANHASGNCVGAIVLNTGGNVAGDWRFFANKFVDNDRFCPGNEEEGTPALSGIGVAIANGANNTLYGNVIKDNNPGGEVAFTGGVVVVNAGIPGANPPSGNVVKGNLILGNEPDVFWDGSGEGNVFERNRCETSLPDGLCRSRNGHDHGHHHGNGHGKHRGHGHDRDHGDGRHDDRSHDDDDRDDRDHDGYDKRW